MLLLITVENRPDIPATAPPFPVVGLIESDQAYPSRLEADGMALLEAPGGPLPGAPARATLHRLLVLGGELAVGATRRRADARVQTQTRDHGVRVAGVRVDREPLTLARF